MKRPSILLALFVGLIVLAAVGVELEERQKAAGMARQKGSSYQTVDYSLNLLPGWVAQESPDSPTTVILTPKQDDKIPAFLREKQFKPIIAIRVEPLSPEGTLKDIADASLESEKKQSAGFVFVSQEFIPIADTFGIKNIFTWSNALYQTTIRQQQIFVKHEGKLFIIDVVLEEKEAALANRTTGELMKSFRFIE